MRQLDPRESMKMSFVKEGEVSIEYMKCESDEESSDKSLSSKKGKRKLILHIEASDNVRGFYYWFTKYTARLPKHNTGFWQHPLELIEEPNVWYYQDKKLGINYFNVLTKRMFAIAGIPEWYSLRYAKLNSSRLSKQSCTSAESFSKLAGSFLLQLLSGFNRKLSPINHVLS